MTARDFIVQEGLEFELLKWEGMEFLGIDETLLEEKLEQYHQLKLKRQ